MPKKPKKIKPYWIPKRKPHKRLIDNSTFYNSTKWRKFAIDYKNKNPLCVECDSREIASPAQVADHIIRIIDGGAKFDESNIQSLCNKCHNSKSGRESKGNKI